MKDIHSISSTDCPPLGFGALEPEYSDLQSARVAVLPVPYESTTTYMTGTVRGPRAIIEASANMETYDEVLRQETFKIGIATLPELSPAGGPRKALDEISTGFRQLLDAGKFPVMIGGEHSISVGGISAAREMHTDLTVLHLDAHADLRDEYEGTAYGHGSVMRRAMEMCPICEVGVRSLSVEEAEFINEKKIPVFFRHEIGSVEEKAEEILSHLSEHVYLSVDMDVFDPSAVPGVGTPEPGGFHWQEVTALLAMVMSKRAVVAMDVVELCPIEGSVVSEFTAAKLIYRALGYLALAEGRL